ncbi:hypothetical protein PVAND_011988 [Polypedilum vanderplanki]|uniref:SUZ RNA-binding domain-containing n=1 Tax=Polypedilum vanderplanki TaxID=319348 RepID=A0A9J6CK83_POLVA|nr:hypothetical protein PVAND_011988 [Polypedilum vanderplanki]
MSREVDISDSWEDIDETELEKRLKEEKIKREQEMSAATNQNGLLVTNGGDNFRPRILQRPKEITTQQNQIKILKRPESSNSSSNQQKSNSKPQIKTLEQREKEYAEARLRILGSSECAASDQKLSPTSSTNNFQNYSQQLQHQQRIPENNINIIRQPRGPQAGTGFNIKR